MYNKTKKYQTDKIWFTSDLHFCHANIVKYSNRPFKGLSDMKESLITNWNNVVKEDDDIFMLGDFALTGNIQTIKSLIESLNGNIHLIYGNHDHRNKISRDSVSSLFASAQNYLEIDVEDNEMEFLQRIILFHYPMMTWNNKLKGSWQLFGHIHSGPQSSAEEKGLLFDKFQYDVGVDNNNYRPISYEEVKVIFTHRALNMRD